MKIQQIILSLLVVLVGLSSFGFCQFAAQAPPQRHPLGYYDPATGSFSPLVPAQDPDAPAVTPTTGTFDFNFTLTVKTAIPKNSVITCNALASVSDPGSGFSAGEQAFGTAKLVSGTTYSCALKIDYSWLLTTPSTDKVNLSVSAGVGEGYEITATNGTGTTVQVVGTRNSSQSIGSIKVPANGATTTETIAMTL